MKFFLNHFVVNVDKSNEEMQTCSHFNQEICLHPPLPLYKFNSKVVFLSSERVWVDLNVS